MSATAEPWFERDPERFKWELDEFARHGLEIKVEEDEERHLLVHVVRGLILEGEIVGVTIEFSHGHPYFGPTVTGDARLLSRHQDPVGLNYCLLEDSHNHWHPARSAGQLVGKNLRQLLADSAVGLDKVRVGEADMAEPTSAQFVYRRGGATLVPETFLDVDLPATSGDMTLAANEGSLRMLVAAAGIGEADSALVAKLIPAPTNIHGRWVALDEVVPERSPARSLLEGVAAVDGTFERRLFRQLKSKRKLDSVSAPLAITFLEQGPTRDEERRTWVFADVHQNRARPPEVRHFIRAQAVTKAERQRRIPELVGLDAVRVVIVGAGSLGAPLALELAKAGVGLLEVVDFDIYDVNNAVRHVVDVADAGGEKTELVAGRCRALNPFIEVRVHQTLLGHRLKEEELLDELTSEATVVVDTTGSQTVARLLSDRCRAAGTALVVVGLTAASYGGEIFVIGGGPCLDCFIDAEESGAISGPPEGERSAVTPIGCRHPAFAGAGFEATELAAIAARTVVRAAGVTAYPPLDVNWIVIDFRGGEHYREGWIDVQPDCRAHAEAV